MDRLPMPLALASRITSGWVWLYTLSLPLKVRARRREEIASHVDCQVETELEEGRSAVQVGASIFRATVRGAPADVRWWLEQRQEQSWRLPPTIAGWEELGQFPDPFWAAAGPPTDRNSWDRQAFFASGEDEVAQLIEIADRLKRPAGHFLALDFGCGLGRLTRPLASRFDVTIGYDVAAGMLAQARDLNADVPGCRFVLGRGSDLGCFETASFDLVITSATLQTLPDKATILGYIRECLRIVRPDGLVAFHLPTRAALSHRRVAFLFLRRMGVDEPTIVRAFRCYPQSIHSIPERETIGFIQREQGHLLHVARHGRHDGRTYFVTK